MIKGKKGMESEMWAPGDMPFWIIFGIVLGFVAVFFVILISSSASQIAEIKYGIEGFFLTQRFTKTQNCFAYDDTLERGVIDYKKFTDADLNNCLYGLAQDSIAFKLTLSSEGSLEFIPKEVHTLNWNENRPSERKLGPRTVLVNNLNKLYNGELSIEMQNYKE